MFEPSTRMVVDLVERLRETQTHTDKRRRFGSKDGFPIRIAGPQPPAVIGHVHPERYGSGASGSPAQCPAVTEIAFTEQAPCSVRLEDHDDTSDPSSLWQHQVRRIGKRNHCFSIFTFIVMPATHQHSSTTVGCDCSRQPLLFLWHVKPRV